MNAKSIITILSASAFLVLGGLSAQAQSSSASPAHEEHHPEGSNEMMGDHSKMMEKMDKGQMKGMMHECMEMHKDGKMCEHQTMEQCQQQMGKSDCHKMMKNVKKEEKKAKSKK